jgi:UDP-N-acetylmuramoyl-tripeptide--D-alanyl-D-alanine ligase
MSQPVQLQWNALDVVEALACAVYGPVADDGALAGLVIDRVAIDTREVEAGSLFVALQGTRSHGIEHAVAAFDNGAAAVLVGTDLEIDEARWEQLLGAASERGPVFVATDCDGVTALGRLARAHRRRMNFRVVGITGSSGKTSTKDILRALLDRAGVRVVASRANWNNEIGVPLTLLAADMSTDVVICEMGMRGAGQIAWLCDIADPDIGIVTTAGTAHLELLGSREAIVEAKAELLAGTWAGGVGIFPGTQDELVSAAARTPDRLLPFGAGPDEADAAAVLVTAVERTADGLRGEIDVMGTTREWSLPVHGLHQARNLAAATAALSVLARSFELLPMDVLQVPLSARATFTGGRGQRCPLTGGGVLIDDSYNANPESMLAALVELAAVDVTMGGRRIAVLGRMAELGKTSGKLHAALGMQAAQLEDIDELVVVGDGIDVGMLAQGWERKRRRAPLAVFDDLDAAIAAFDDWFRPEDVVLVKASLSSELGRLAAAAVERHGAMERTRTIEVGGDA